MALYTCAGGTKNVAAIYLLYKYSSRAHFFFKLRKKGQKRDNISSKEIRKTGGVIYATSFSVNVTYVLIVSPTLTNNY